jgi:hypothetical protein
MSAFRKTGVILYNPAKVLYLLQKTTRPPNVLPDVN